VSGAVPGARLLAASRVAFGEEAVSRWLEPLVADMQHEWRAAGDAAARRRAVWGGLRALPAPLAMAALRAGPSGLVAPLAPLLLVGALGVGLLSATGSAGDPPWARLQALWLVIGLLVACGAATVRWRGGGGRLLLLAAAGAALFTLAQGARWVVLPIVGLTVAPLELGLIPLVPGLVATVPRRRVGAVALGAGYAIVAAHAGDPAVGAAAVAVTLAAALPRSAGRWTHVLPTMAAVGVVVLVAAPASGALDAHTDGILGALASRGGAAAVALAVALYGMVVVRLASASARGGAGRAAQLASVLAHLLVGRAAAHLASLAMGLEVGGLPPLGYGGSALVATFALVGLAGGAAARRRVLAA
jgi:hypothetical protein